MRSLPSWHVFERVAGAYDEVLPFFAAIGERLVAAVGPGPGTRHLDIGAGRGALVGPSLDRGCAVTAVDAAPAMVARLAADFPQARTLVMDAEHLVFPDASFDLATAAFVVHLLDRPARGVEEAFRVLAPGGRFAVPVGAAVRAPEPAAIQDDMDALFAEFAPHLPPGGGMGAAIDMRRAMSAAGFVDLEERHIEVVVPVPDGDALWDWCRSHGYLAFIEDLPDDRREEFRLRMRALARAGGVLQRAHAVLIGRRPRPTRREEST
ncbi:methyltransferase domain-containing protein [Glycomyces sp. A-F 0318]|uniref:class I SAM-dependent methyltransferase n=1 Tax=Glycomyces amatae TaxID=2881355 RepID=UPI001E327FDE|nr:class I SAM-dependent methyltransferase [Glycomyces amatae]MCD0443239.1 methyltransferase domain-containing protein [Glycomyces amatae]